MYLLRSQLWVGDLAEFHERMCGRLHRNEQAGWMYEQASKHQNLVADTRSLVEALADLLATSSA
jgi:putative SOS response-associated peptidase YedK